MNNETTDPTAGERVCDGCGKPASEATPSDLLSTWWADYECCSMPCTMRAVAEDATPAEPDAGDVPRPVEDVAPCGCHHPKIAGCDHEPDAGDVEANDAQ